MSDLESLTRDMARAARRAATALLDAPAGAKDDWLRRSADRLIADTDDILTANRRDLDGAESLGLTKASIDRLRLTPDRVAGMAEGLRQVAGLPDPVGEVREESTRPNGLIVRRVGVPLGVIFFIYESRPNVTADAAALCVKGGNAVILRGGKEALYTNAAIHARLRACLGEAGLPADAAQLVPVADRDAVGLFLRMGDDIDLAIPRGGPGLIRRVAAEAKMPVLKHDAGNCHVYVDEHADLAAAEAIAVNAKCQRPGVCNAAESLLVHEAVAAEFLPRVAKSLTGHGVELRGCPRTRELVPAAAEASESDHAAEFLDLILSIQVVQSVDQAVTHINRHGSGHTDAIVTRDEANAERFTRGVDSSAVLVNASTRFNDGFELGLGAEVGISTGRLHARGPCGLRELTAYKYVIRGGGQVRL